MRIDRRTILGLAASAFMIATSGTAMAQDAANSKTLITNVSIFDGTNETRITGKDVAISGNTISKAKGDQKWLF